jgi:hypothetical protein
MVKMTNSRPAPKLTDHHLYFSLWLTPWSWERPSIWRSKHRREFTICFVFGQLDLIIDRKTL